MDTIRVVVADDDREATDYLIQPLLERHADIKVVEIMSN